MNEEIKRLLSRHRDFALAYERTEAFGEVEVLEDLRIELAMLEQEIVDELHRINGTNWEA